MDSAQGFKRNHPCPICGGHPDLPQHEGRRCYGYLSDYGLYAHCTREEHAGRLGRNGNSDTFAHYLMGDCRCGVTHGERAPARPHAHCTREEHVGRLGRNGNSDTFAHYLMGDCRCGVTHGERAPARPHAKGSRPPPSVDSYRHPKWGRPSRRWAYRYANGEVASYAARWDPPDSGKKIRPLLLTDGQWLLEVIDSPSPLHNLLELWERPQWRRERKVGPHAGVTFRSAGSLHRGLFPNA